MNKPNAQEMRARIEEGRRQASAERRREEEAMDAFAVRAVRSLTAGLPLPDEDAGPDPQEIRARLEQRREHDREAWHRTEEEMDAFAASAAQSLVQGLGLLADDARPRPEESEIDQKAMTEAQARRAIEARRLAPASPTAETLPGETPLRAALRGIVEDYAAAITPSDRTVEVLEELHGIALDAADTYGLWADLDLEAAMAVRSEMADIVEVVTDRAESVIVEELVATARRLYDEYPEAPWPEARGAKDLLS